MHSGAFSEDGVADNLDDVFRISVGLFSLKHKTSNKLTWRTKLKTNTLSDLEDANMDEKTSRFCVFFSAEDKN